VTVADRLELEHVEQFTHVTHDVSLVRILERGTLPTPQPVGGFRSMEITPLSPNIGARVTGLDCSRPLSDGELEALRAAWLEHLVLFLPDQPLTHDEQTAFAEQFGQLTVGHPVEPPLAEDRRVHPIDSAYGSTDFWHTDVTFMPRPPMGAVLRAVQLPPVGGDTMWVSTRAAYDDLAEPLRRLCDELTAIHYDPHYAARVAAGEGNEWEGKQVTRILPVSHPMVRVHPETGRKALFVNPQFTVGVGGISGPQSKGFLQFLYDHMTRPEYLVRHRWEPNMMAMWDNRATMHYGVRDYGDAHRVMHRVTWAGDRPIGPNG
jgi:taurine dioxygenase